VAAGRPATSGSAGALTARRRGLSGSGLFRWRSARGYGRQLLGMVDAVRAEATPAIGVARWRHRGRPPVPTPARRSSKPGLGEGQKRGGGDQLERSEGMAVGPGVEPWSKKSAGWGAGSRLGQPDPLAPSSPGGGGIEPQAQPAALRAPWRGNNRALAVLVPGHLHGRKATFGMARFGQGGLAGTLPGPGQCRGG